MAPATYQKGIEMHGKKFHANLALGKGGWEKTSVAEQGGRANDLIMSAVAPVVLMADDTEDDVFMFRWAMLRAQLAFDLRSFRDGRDVVEYLSGSGLYAVREEYPVPVVTLLECQLPGLSGMGVLAWARRQPGLKNHPVVMLTGAANEVEERQTRKLGADCYFQKSSDYRGVIDYVRPMFPSSERAKAA